MRLIPMVCVAMLLAATFALELGSSNKGVAFVPTIAGPTKFRPDDLIQPIPRVVSLEEAVQRHDESASSWVATPDKDGSDICLVENCSLDLHLFWVKHFLKKYILG